MRAGQDSIHRVDLPLDFISCVQTWTSSWISSGATSLRVHDSSQRGLGGAAGSRSDLADFCLSFELKTFLKNGILGGWQGAWPLSWKRGWW